MKKKTGVVITSAAAIAVCASVMAGSTYALFTSESQTDIVVKSANVKMTATVENKVSSHKAYDEAAGDYVVADGLYGGEAVFENNTLTVTNFAPYDTVAFDLAIKNESTVTVKYRTKLWCSGNAEFFKYLDVKVDGVAYDGEQVLTQWTEATVGEEIDPIHIEIAFPDGENVNDYKDQTCAISYYIEAVQGNAYTEDYFTVTDENGVTKGYATFAEAFADVKDGGTINLNADVTLDSSVVSTAKNVIFNGNNHTITFKTGYTVDAPNFGLRFNGVNGSAGNVTIKDLKVKGDSALGIMINGGSNDKDSILDNVTVDGNFGYAGVYFQSSNGGKLVNCNITNNLPDTSSVHYNEYKLGALGVFVNRAVAAPLYLENTYVDTLYVNRSGKDAVSGTVAFEGYQYSEINHTGTKLYVNEGSTVDYLVTSGENLKKDGKFIGTDFYAVNGGTVNYAMLCWEPLPRLLSDKSTYIISSAAYLANWHDAVKSGAISIYNSKFIISEDIDATGYTWESLWVTTGSHSNNGIVVDGKNNIISNLTIVSSSHNCGLFSGSLSGREGNPAEFKNLTFDNATVIAGGINVGVIAGQLYNETVLDNVNVINSTVIGNYKVAALVGVVYDENANVNTVVTIKNCTVANTTVKAAVHDFGTCGMVGWVAIDNGESVVFENCVLDGVTLDCSEPKSDYDYHYWAYYNGDYTGVNEQEGLTVKDNCTVIE